MKKRILVVGANPESLVNFRGHLLHELVIQGYDVYAASNKLIENKSSKEFLKGMGITPFNLPLSRTGINPIKDFITFLCFLKFYIIRKPDIVLAYTVKPVVWGGLSSIFFKKQKFFGLITGLGYAFTDKTSRKRRIIRNIVKVLYRLALKNANGIIFQNPDDLEEFFKESIIRKKSNTYLVNGSGVSLDDFPFNKPKSQKLEFLMISRLVGDKGVREYIEAGKILNNLNVVAELHLIGSIDQNPDSLTSKEVNSWRQLKWFKWHGPQKNVIPFINNSSVFVLPSYREGTPRSVLEAMSIGRAIITTDAPGCRETVIPNRNGFLVPIRNSNKLAEAMKKFIHYPELINSMGLESRLMAEEKYDVKKINITMMNILESSN